MKFKGGIIITDPCYLKIDNVENKLKGLFSDTGYGDWSCTTFVDSPETEKFLQELNRHYFAFFATYNSSPKKSNQEKDIIFEKYQKERKELLDNPLILGQFCADSGEVCVVYLDEVLKLNSEFDYHINNKHTTTLIKDFDGVVNIVYDEKADCNRVIGKGNINFFTSQTGF